MAGGYHFISLSTDEPNELNAIFHQSTMDWLREKLDEDRNTARPTFLFLHQSMDNTVSGSLPGEGWSGVQNEQLLRDVLADYPEVMFFNGHSHWTMDSVGNMFDGDQKLPCRAFNCASVAYLWSGYNVVTGEHLNGSQGYMVKLCDGKLYVLGRDFARGEWIPAAQYCIVLKEVTEPETEAPTEAPTDAPTEAPTDEPVDTPANDSDATDNTAAPDGTNTGNATEAPESGCGSSLAALTMVLLLPAAYVVIKRKEN